MIGGDEGRRGAMPVLVSLVTQTKVIARRAICLYSRWELVTRLVGELEAGSALDLRVQSKASSLWALKNVGSMVEKCLIECAGREDLVLEVFVCWRRAVESLSVNILLQTSEICWEGLVVEHDMQATRCLRHTLSPRQNTWFHGSCCPFFSVSQKRKNMSLICSIA